MPSSPILGAHLRIARPTDNIDALRTFYIDGLGFDILYDFKDHAGFDGLMLGHPSAQYHLEFTRKQSHEAGRAPTEDNLLVFYLPDEQIWKEVVARMEGAGFAAVKAFNPYWEEKGKTFEDADRYRVVLQNAGWSNDRVRQRYLASRKAQEAHKIVNE